MRPAQGPASGRRLCNSSRSTSVAADSTPGPCPGVGGDDIVLGPSRRPAPGLPRHDQCSQSARHRAGRGNRTVRRGRDRAQDVRRGTGPGRSIGRSNRRALSLRSVVEVGGDRSRRSCVDDACVRCAAVHRGGHRRRPRGCALRHLGDRGWRRDPATGVFDSVAQLAVAPSALAVDGLGRLVVAEPYRLVRFDLGTGTAEVLAGTGAPGAPGTAAEGPAPGAVLAGVTDVTAGMNSDLVFVEGDGHRVVRYDAQRRGLQTLAGTGTGMTNAPDISVEDPNRGNRIAREVELPAPAEVAAGVDGLPFFAADPTGGDHRVFTIDDNMGLAIVAGGGQEEPAGGSTVARRDWAPSSPSRSTRGADCSSRVRRLTVSCSGAGRSSRGGRGRGGGGRR